MAARTVVRSSSHGFPRATKSFGRVADKWIQAVDVPGRTGTGRVLGVKTQMLSHGLEGEWAPCLAGSPDEAAAVLRQDGSLGGSHLAASMADTKCVRVFIGSGEQSLLERKTLIWSLRKHTRRPLDVYVFNGTHNAIERNDEPPAPAPLSLRLKYRNWTEFSLYRYLIPALCNYEGRAIYLDSDIVCIADIGELFDVPMDRCDFLATRAYADGEWAMSVQLIDCSRCRFNLEAIFNEIDQGLFTYLEFARMNPHFRAYHSYTIGDLDPRWNVLDAYDKRTKLVHYTELLTQPWKYPNHPSGDVWFQYFNEAIAVGLITKDDVHRTIQRGYARPDVCDGNNPQPQGYLGMAVHRIGKLWSSLNRRLASPRKERTRSRAEQGCRRNST